MPYICVNLDTFQDCKKKHKNFKEAEQCPSRKNGGHWVIVKEGRKKKNK